MSYLKLPDLALCVQAVSALAFKRSRSVQYHFAYALSRLFIELICRESSCCRKGHHDTHRNSPPFQFLKVICLEPCTVFFDPRPPKYNMSMTINKTWHNHLTCCIQYFCLRSNKRDQIIFSSYSSDLAVTNSNRSIFYKTYMICGFSFTCQKLGSVFNKDVSCCFVVHLEYLRLQESEGPKRGTPALRSFCL